MHILCIALPQINTRKTSNTDTPIDTESATDTSTGNGNPSAMAIYSSVYDCYYIIVMWWVIHKWPLLRYLFRIRTSIPLVAYNIKWLVTNASIVPGEWESMYIWMNAALADGRACAGAGSDLLPLNGSDCAVLIALLLPVINERLQIEMMSWMAK